MTNFDVDDAVRLRRLRGELRDAVTLLLPYLPEDCSLTNERLADWLRTVEGTLRLVYRVSGAINIEVKKEDGERPPPGFRGGSLSVSPE